MTEQRLQVQPIEGPYFPVRSVNRLAWLGRVARRKPLGFASFIVVVLLILVAIFAPVVAMDDPYALNASQILAGPSLENPVGTDLQGRDLWARVIYGSRSSIYTGFGAVAIATALAMLIGVSSAFIGGWYDLGVQRLVEIMMAFPGLIFLLTVVSMFGSGLWQVIVSLGILFSFSSSRIIRASALSEKQNDYILAARVIGCSPIRTMWRHLLPNLFAPIMIVATTLLGTAILAEASLSFLGFGVPPPTPTWGQMLSGTIYYWRQQPWLPLAPGIAISIVVFAFNMLGDSLRDIFDPRLRGGAGGV